MWLDQLSAQLRVGLDEVRAELESTEFDIARRSDAALSRFSLQTLIDFARTPSREIASQDVVWLAVLSHYRQDSRRLWSPLLLEMLAPDIVDTAYRLAIRWGGTGAADLVQQLLLAVLTAAQDIHLDASSCFVKLRLIREARRRTQRWAAHTVHQPPPSVDEVAPDDAAVWILSDLRLSAADTSDVDMLLRVTSGYSHSEIGTELGISTNAARLRVRRARARLRDLLTQ